MLLLSVLTESTKFDVTRWCGIPVIFLSIIAVCGVFSVVESSMFLNYFYCGLGTFPFPLWILLDMQLIISRKRKQIDINDYFYAVLQVYVDITDLVHNFIFKIIKRCKC